MENTEHTADYDARMTPDEERDIRAAFERDKWAGEWNSLPTAIDRMLRFRAEARVFPPGDPVCEQGACGERAYCDEAGECLAATRDLSPGGQQ